MMRNIINFSKILLIIFFVSFVLNYQYFLILYLKLLIILFLNKYNDTYILIKNNPYTLLYLHFNFCIIIRIKNKFQFYLLLNLYSLIQIFLTIILYIFNYNLVLCIDLKFLSIIRKSFLPYLYLTYILTWLYMRLNNLNYRNKYIKRTHRLIIFFSYFFIFYDPWIFIDICLFIFIYIIIPLFEFYFYTFVRPICRLCYISGLFLTLVCFDMFNEKGSIKKHILVIILFCIYIYIKCYIVYAHLLKKCQIL